uniref:Jasmonate O-methyltransferase n=1 Tax=Triticum aestivum TaxID=4565 RepID=A0A077RYJ4_WHEAT|nr:unnamed protein product [Triticum aestivum]
MKSLIEGVIVELCSNAGTLQPRKIVIADLGCSSGPNALALVSIAVNAIHAHYLQFQQPSPEVSVLLNDLPENDFNTVVKSLVTLRQSNNPVVLTGITPGSFYERLFTSESVHLICSSNTYIGSQRYESDATLMDRSCCITHRLWCIDKEKFDSFYGLMHEPSLKELREIIQEEGSFSIREMREHDPRTDINKTLSTPGIFAGFLRSLFEPVIVQHFGYVMDEFVRTVERRYILEGSLQEERAKCPYAMLVVSLAKA